MKKFLLIGLLGVAFFMAACNNGQEPGSTQTQVDTYTCPMPEDSVFSDKPGTCPKCGMDLVKADPQQSGLEYTCPMHPEIIRDKPGSYPVCGMDLVKKESNGEKMNDKELASLLKPANEFVVSSIPLITTRQQNVQPEIEALGVVGYDTRQVGSISSRISGRIEKLYVRYKYQKVSKGQRILDIYSPEMLTAQQNLLFLVKDDPGNTGFIEVAKEKLLLLGMSKEQLQQVMKAGKPSFTIAVYSNYSGHIQEAGAEAMANPEDPMKNTSMTTGELSLKEGMYIQKGQSVFSVFDPGRAWVILNIYGSNQSQVKVGDPVRVVPETAPGKDFRAAINFIEPFYRKESKTVTARIYFNNNALKIPIGSQVRATVFGNTFTADWLPGDAVLSLGLHQVVFLKSENGFSAHKIKTGMMHKDQVQVLEGLSKTDSVASKAQYLMDSESFIKIKN